MRRFQALLIVAGLVAAPAGAAAGPSPNQDTSQRSVEVFEWSTGKGRLGMTVIGLTPPLRTHFGATSQSGMLVGSVAPDTPAARAGIRVGDVIVEVNHKLVDDAGDIRSVIAGSKKGDVVDIGVIRDRKPLTLKATVVDDPSPLPSIDAFWHGNWLRELMKSFEEQKRATTTPPTNT